MGDRHGGRFARRGRALSPPRRDFPMPRRGLPMAQGGGQDLPAQERSLGEGLSTRRTSERICPAQKHAPRRRPPDTAHERKDLPHAGTRPAAKASRHGARAKGFAPRGTRPLGEGIPTRRTGERVCPARERSPRRRPTDTAHGRKNLPREVRVRPTCRRTAAAPDRRTAGKTPLRRDRTRDGAVAAEFIHRKK